MRTRPPALARAIEFRQHLVPEMIEVMVLAEEAGEVGGQDATAFRGAPLRLPARRRSWQYSRKPFRPRLRMCLDRRE